jgi:hypothetical protein
MSRAFPIIANEEIARTLLACLLEHCSRPGSCFCIPPPRGTPSPWPGLVPGFLSGHQPRAGRLRGNGNGSSFGRGRPSPNRRARHVALLQLLREVLPHHRSRARPRLAGRTSVLPFSCFERGFSESAVGHFSAGFYWRLGFGVGASRHSVFALLSNGKGCTQCRKNQSQRSTAHRLPPTPSPHYSSRSRDASRQCKR